MYCCLYMYFSREEFTTEKRWAFVSILIGNNSRCSNNKNWVSRYENFISLPLFGELQLKNVFSIFWIGEFGSKTMWDFFLIRNHKLMAGKKSDSWPLAYSHPLPSSKQTIDLLFMNNKICKHVTKFNTIMKK